jgi:hypothetical protein
MCVQEEDRLKSSHGGSLNYVKDNKKRDYNQSNHGSPSKSHGKSHMQYQHQQKSLRVDKEDKALQERLPCLAKVNNGKEW